VSRKPKVIETGKCYRLYRWANCGFGSREPGDMIAYVYAIDGNKQRWVRCRSAGEHDLGYNAVPYSQFIRMVHSEAPEARN
jgi:hypothetical protein